MKKIWIVVYHYDYEGYGEPLYAGTQNGAEKYVLKRLKEDLPDEVFKDYDDYYGQYQNGSCYEIFDLEVGE